MSACAALRVGSTRTVLVGLKCRLSLAHTARRMSENTCGIEWRFESVASVDVWRGVGQSGAWHFISLWRRSRQQKGHKRV